MSESTRSELASLSYLVHEQKSVHGLLSLLKDDIARLQKEVEKLELERRWCFDAGGKRIRVSPLEEAARISTLCTETPGSERDVMQALKKKKTSLQMEVNELEERQRKSMKNFPVT